MEKSYFYFFAKYLLFFRQGVWKLRNIDQLYKCAEGGYDSMKSHTFYPVLIPVLIIEMKKYFYIEIQMSRDLIAT